MTRAELYNYLENRIPKELSCAWDNDGLMACGDINREVSKVMLALDATSRSVSAAHEMGCDVLLCHHPMIFKGMKSVTELTMEGARVMNALKNDVCVFSYHTRLDADDDGVNDALCRALGFEACGKFGDDESPTLGRIAVIEDGITLNELAQHVKRSLNCPYVKLAALDMSRKVKKIALCGGDGKDMIKPAMACGAEVLITGQGGYNAMQDAAEMGFAVIEAGHYYTEVPVLNTLAAWLKELGIETVTADSCDETVI